MQKKITHKQEYANSALDFALIVFNLYHKISKKLMEPSGLEPLTLCMPCRSPTKL